MLRLTTLSALNWHTSYKFSYDKITFNLTFNIQLWPRDNWCDFVLIWCINFSGLFLLTLYFELNKISRYGKLFDAKHPHQLTELIDKKKHKIQQLSFSLECDLSWPINWPLIELYPLILYEILLIWKRT